MTVERKEIRISTVTDDWVSKGCHVHVGRTEVALRPSHEGLIVYRGIFSWTEPDEVEAAGRLIHERLMSRDAEFQEQLKKAIDRAMTFFTGVEGDFKRIARGRLYEMRRLQQILERMERTL
jgi:hypothetical protein